MNRKALKITALFSVLFLLLPSCSPFVKKTMLEGKTRIKFGATYMNMSNPFFNKLNDGIKKVVEAENGKLIALDAQLDNKKQISQIEDLIAQEVDIIFLNPVDWKAVKPALEAAVKAHIPVIVVDAPVFNEELVDCTVVSDNNNAGVLCAQDLIKRLDGKGDIVLLDHPTAKSAMDRIEGFTKTIKENSNIKIIVQEPSNGQLEIAMDSMNKILSTRRKFQAVMCLNDPTALGVIAALEGSKKKDEIFVYGIDGSEDALKQIASGKLTATAAQFPYKIGKTAAETALKKLKGETIDKLIKIPVELINKDNIDKYYDN